MADGDDDKGGKGGGETVESLKAKLKASENASAALLKKVEEAEGKASKLEADKKAAEAEQLKQKGEFEKLYNDSLPKVKRMEALEPVLNDLLELEIKDIPEDKRKLIPHFDAVENKLKWVKEAKAGGLFGEPKKTPPNSDGKPPKDGITPEFLSWDANDPRMTSLTTDQYLEWKKHNRKGNIGKVVGWGG